MRVQPIGKSGVTGLLVGFVADEHMKQIQAIVVTEGGYFVPTNIKNIKAVGLIPGVGAQDETNSQGQTPGEDNGSGQAVQNEQADVPSSSPQGGKAADNSRV